MKTDLFPQLNGPEVLVCIIDEVLGDFNMGLLIYHLENLGDPRTLKLIYANPAASRYTGVDLQPRVGKYIAEAFPPLTNTELPKAFQEVILKKEAARIGMVEYSDHEIGRSAYSVKAFPMPNQCVGVVFENIALRKQVDALLKKHTSELEEEATHLQAQFEKLSQELLADLKQIRSDIKQLETGKARFNKKQILALNDLKKMAQRISKFLKSWSGLASK